MVSVDENGPFGPWKRMDAIVVSNFFRILAVPSVGLLCAASLAGNGYLVRVGPKPLRFAAAPHRNPNIMLPPLKMDDTPTNNPAMLEPFGPQPLTPPDSPDVTEPVLGPELPPAANLIPAPEPAAPVAADALLDIFTPGRHKAGILTTPVDFTPPRTGSTPSSTATYISQ